MLQWKTILWSLPTNAWIRKILFHSEGNESTSLEVKMENEIWDQYQYLGNCPPTLPLTWQQSIDNKLGLMLG